MRHEGPAPGPLARPYDEGLRLLLFGGKGGVGKTTVAAAFSLRLSDRYPGKRFLVVSTDPAHSLSDSFGFPLGAAPTPVYGLENLHGLELDAEKLLERFRVQDGPAVKKILGRGTYLDDEDLSRFLELSFPGLDEVMALLRIMELVGEGTYDVLILDTAPTGHTLRLLELPVLIRAWTGFLDTLMAKHRFLSQVYTRGYRRDDADKFIDGLTRGLEGIRELLRDSRRCRFVPIALAEPMVLFETERLIRALVAKGIPVRSILINQVRSEADGCGRCRQIAERQRRQLEAFRRRWPELEVALLLAQSEEVAGEVALRAVGASAAPGPEPELETAAPGPAPPPGAVRVAAPEPEVQLMLFCGKGGVGKTTLASAVAVELSRQAPEKRILLFSTDPAHSLSDCLGEPVGREPTPVGGAANLFAVEIDPASLFQEFKRTYARQIDEVFGEFSRRADMELRFDREVLVGLLDLAPPGLDEVMALAQLANYVAQGSYDLYLLDTAPTGHALRFLELPALARDWLRAFFEILLKYRTAVRLPTASELLVDLSKKVRQVQELFSDPLRCEGVLIAVPTEMTLRETGRLAAALARLGIPVRRLVINRVLPSTDDCPYCRSLARTEHAMRVRLEEAFPELEVAELPEWPTGPAGADGLSRLISLTPSLKAGA